MADNTVYKIDSKSFYVAAYSQFAGVVSARGSILTGCIFAAVLVLATSLNVFASNHGSENPRALSAEPINTLVGLGPGVWQTSDVAIMGYDPVAYFLNHQAKKGLPRYQVRWRGATWLFSSMTNQAAFEDNPDSFAPQYGGYSAHGVANGHLVKIDPYSWAVIDGKLYLNYKEKFHRHWLENADNLIESANQRFENMVIDLPEYQTRPIRLNVESTDEQQVS